MQVPLEWLKEFVDISASPDEIAVKLTMVGLEVEGIETIDGDAVFEVDVTPNRPDCLSILGIAREVAAAFGLTLKIYDTSIKGTLPGSDIQVEILNPELCNRYAGRLIKGVAISDSPEWIKKRLEKSGIRSLNNNIVDITNYVLLELGHPLHAFDADKLYGGKIIVAKAGKNRSFTTLDGIERKLSKDSLLIWDKKNPVAIAGIMGGEESGVTFETKNIFLESAYFDPISIRKTSKELGLKSESSYRFERGTDIIFLENALNRAAMLIKETGGGIVHEIVDVYPERYIPKTIEVSYSRVNSLIGTDLKQGEILRMLESIGIKAKDKGKNFQVFVPSYRRDITRYVDVIEEIARIFGYGRIPAEIPRAVLSDGVLNRKEININKIREAVRKAGFTEVINYSFMNQYELDMLLLSKDNIRRRYLKLKNPLRQEDSLMRTTLIPSLINNCVYNLSRDINDIRFFEIARIYLDQGKELPSEELRLAGIFYRENISSVWKYDAPAFFVVKGAIQSLFKDIKINGCSFIPSEEGFLHKGKSSDIILKNVKIGFIGELGPSVVESLNLKIHKPEIIVFELNIDKILSFLPERLTYCQIPKYPSVQRDIAIIVDEDISSAEIVDVIDSFKSEFIENVELFDYYKGKNIPQNKKSLAFRIIYRSDERTLTDSEVESIHHSLVKYIVQNTGGELRR